MQACITDKEGFYLRCGQHQFQATDLARFVDAIMLCIAGLGIDTGTLYILVIKDGS